MMTTKSETKHKTRFPVIVRVMDIDDLAAVFHLGEQLFTAQEAPNLYRTWDEHEIVQLFDSDREFCLVAEVQGQFAGFLLGSTVEKSRSAWKYGLLIWLGVVPEFQRAGVAHKLFYHFRDLMIQNGVRMLVMDTEAENLPALHFFRKVGFGKPEEHIYMSLNLADYKRANNHKKHGGSGNGAK